MAYSGLKMQNDYNWNLDWGHMYLPPKEGL